MDSPGLDLESCDTIEGNNLKKLQVQSFIVANRTKRLPFLLRGEFL